MGTHGAGSIITREGTDKLYIRYYVNGKQVQEATGTASREEAQEHRARPPVVDEQ